MKKVEKKDSTIDEPIIKISEGQYFGWESLLDVKDNQLSYHKYTAKVSSKCLIFEIDVSNLETHFRRMLVTCVDSLVKEFEKISHSLFESHIEKSKSFIHYHLDNLNTRCHKPKKEIYDNYLKDLNIVLPTPKTIFPFKAKPISQELLLTFVKSNKVNKKEKGKLKLPTTNFTFNVETDNQTVLPTQTNNFGYMESSTNLGVNIKPIHLNTSTSASKHILRNQSANPKITKFKLAANLRPDSSELLLENKQIRIQSACSKLSAPSFYPVSSKSHADMEIIKQRTEILKSIGITANNKCEQRKRIISAISTKTRMTSAKSFVSKCVSTGDYAIQIGRAHV